MPVIVPHAEVYIKKKNGKTYLIKRFRRIKITLSRKLPADVCEITLPKLDSLKLFEENDEILVILGNDKIGSRTVFKGYITYISPTDEPILKAEDYFKIFKEKRNSKSYFDTAPNIAKDVISFCGFEPVIEGEWNSKTHFYWKMQTAAEVLEELSKIGWDYFLIPGTKKVYFGIPFGLYQDEKVFIYRFGFNIISSDLEYRTKSPIGKVIVYITDINFRGDVIKVEKGEGEPVKIFNLQMDFDPSNQNSVNGAIGQAEKFAQRQLNLSKISGYFGNFQTFGNPFLTHSMKIKIEDPERKERDGHYFVDQVIHDFSPDTGYKMDIYVGGIENVPLYLS